MNQKQLESLNLDDLPYPMFETTEQEKVWLQLVSPQLSAKNSDYYLCCILNDVLGEDVVVDLVDKVQSSLDDCLSLVSYLGAFYISNSEKVLLRQIWIRKLLEYKGE